MIKRLHLRDGCHFHSIYRYFFRNNRGYRFGRFDDFNDMPMSSLLKHKPRPACSKRICKTEKSIKVKMVIGPNPLHVWKEIDKFKDAPSEIPISKEAAANYIRKVNLDKRCPHYKASLDLAKWIEKHHKKSIFTQDKQWKTRNKVFVN